MYALLGADAFDLVIFKSCHFIGRVSHVITASVQTTVASLSELVHFKASGISYRLGEVGSDDVFLTRDWAVHDRDILLIGTVIKFVDT